MRLVPFTAIAVALTALVLAASPPAALAMLAMDPIRQVIRAASPQIIACTDRCFACPHGEYTTVVAFTIEADGHVSGAEVQSTDLPDLATAACFARVVTGLSFPSVGSARRVGSVRVNYPFRVTVGPPTP